MNKLEAKIIELWTVSRTALASMSTVPHRIDRMKYVLGYLKYSHPELIEGMTHKSVWFLIEDLTAPTRPI